MRSGGTIWQQSVGRGGDIGFGPSHRGFGNWTLNEEPAADRCRFLEQGVSGNETSNAEEEVASECRVINRRGKISKGDRGVE
jgi:hypothetical protein